MTIPTHIWEAYWSEAKPGTEEALERVIAELDKPPVAFNWTPEMRALWPDHMRPTMTGLLAIWEALQGAAVYPGYPYSTEPVTDGWIKNDGFQPVDDEVDVEVKFLDGLEEQGLAKLWYWQEMSTSRSSITHWRLAK